MTRQQLEYDVAGEDFDREEDIAQLEHYQLHGDKPRLMPDLSDMGRLFSSTFRGGDSIYG